MFKQPTQRYPFEDFITDTRQARTGAQLFEHLQCAVAQYGFDQMILSTPFDPDLSPEHQRFGLFNTYPDDWTEYDRNGYVRYDPVVRAVALWQDPFTWRHMEDVLPLSDQQKRLIRWSEDIGMYNGMAVPFHGRQSLLAGMGLASSVAGEAPPPEHIDLVAALCTQFYSAYKRLYPRAETSTDTPIYLSAKQTEILKWVAAGKTDEEIATILTISRNTVDSHMRQIFHKLNAVNRVTAVVTGLTKGHITL